jgi:hypothetical protein
MRPQRSAPNSSSEWLGPLSVAGIFPLFRQRVLGEIVFLGMGAAIVASLLGWKIDHLTERRELQDVRRTR